MSSWQRIYTKDQLISRIRRHAAAGQTAAFIAELLGCGLTRNQIIGFAYRAKPRISFGNGSGPARSALKFSIIGEGESDGTSMTMAESRRGDHRCRFPLWPHRIGQAHGKPQPHEMIFCGARALEGMSWCAEHRAVVYTKAAPNG